VLHSLGCQQRLQDLIDPAGELRVMPPLFLAVRHATAAAHPPACNDVQEGMRVVAVPWPTAGGVGTWQQYVCVPEEHLVRAERLL
jgi:hypothetical protein